MLKPNDFILSIQTSESKVQKPWGSVQEHIKVLSWQAAWQMSVQDSGTSTALTPFFSGSLQGAEVKLYSDESPHGIKTAKRTQIKQTRVNLQNLRQQQIIRQLQAWTSSRAALMIHISWIKHQRQRQQQVSRTMCIRIALYLGIQQHIARSRSSGSLSCSMRGVSGLLAAQLRLHNPNWKMVLCNYPDWSLNQIRAAVDVVYRLGHLSNTIERPANRTF